MSTLDNLDIDLYQARMLIGYYLNGMKDIQAVMEAFCRKLPNNRRFLVVCGTDRIVEFIQDFRFGQEEIKILKELFKEIDFDSTGLQKYLEELDPAALLRVNIIPDGSVVFANEPVVQVEGPIGLCQYIEKKILSILNHDIRIASKAARVVLAAQGRPIFEFGGRRANDACTPVTARAAYIAGCESSSSVAAYVKYGVPCSGTMGHVWVMSHDTEIEAFKNWHAIFPTSTYLIDTYNPYDGFENAKGVAGASLGAVRLDSGNLGEQASWIKRKINNGAKIVASNDLNEYSIKELVRKGAPIDAFGVGTEIVATPDAPTCGFVYKLVAVTNFKGEWRNVSKFSAGGKATIPGAKQIYRFKSESTGHYTHDLVTLRTWDQNLPQTVREHVLVLASFQFKGHPFDIKQSTLNARKNFQNTLSKLPPYLKIISKDDCEPYPVEIDDILSKEINKILKYIQ